eukprot:4222582-Pleurochrysis_carterae.AAC.1
MRTCVKDECEARASSVLFPMWVGMLALTMLVFGRHGRRKFPLSPFLSHTHISLALPPPSLPPCPSNPPLSLPLPHLHLHLYLHLYLFSLSLSPPLPFPLPLPLYLCRLSLFSFSLPPYLHSSSPARCRFTRPMPLHPPAAHTSPPPLTISAGYTRAPLRS